MKRCSTSLNKTYSAKKWTNTHFQTSQVLEADQWPHWSISVLIMHALAAAAYAVSAPILLAGNQQHVNPAQDNGIQMSGQQIIWVTDVWVTIVSGSQSRD